MKRGFLNTNTTKQPTTTSTSNKGGSDNSDNSNNNNQQQQQHHSDDNLGPLKDPRIQRHNRLEEIKMNMAKSVWVHQQNSAAIRSNDSSSSSSGVGGWGRHPSSSSSSTGKKDIPNLVHGSLWGKPKSSMNPTTTFHEPKRSRLEEKTSHNNNDDNDNNENEKNQPGKGLYMKDILERLREVESAKLTNNDMEVDTAVAAESQTTTTTTLVTSLSTTTAMPNGNQQQPQPQQSKAKTKQPPPRNPLEGMIFMPTSQFGSAKLALNALYGKESLAISMDCSSSTTTGVDFGQQDKAMMGIVVELTNASFFSWDDNGPSHLRKHTCVFVCPITYERFPAGRYGNDDSNNSNNSNKKKYHVDPSTNIVWFTQKKLAEHGAAARRYDCFVYRKNCELVERKKNEMKMKKKQKQQLQQMDNGTAATAATVVPEPPLQEEQDDDDDDDEETNKLQAQRIAHWGLDLPYKKNEGPVVVIPDHIEERIEAQVAIWKEEALVRAEKVRQRKLAQEQEAMEIEERIREQQAYREQRLVV